jgi:hypothetical protein
MAVLRLDRFTVGPVGTAQMLARHVAAVAAATNV